MDWARTTALVVELLAEVVCVRYSGVARYVAGYDHIVYLGNDCDAPSSCVVWTDVNPEPQTVIIPAHETIAVMTFRGSPSSVFFPVVRCVDAEK